MTNIVRESNHKRAPKCAAVVEALREAFGEVQIVYVNEGGVLIGKPPRYVSARLFELWDQIQERARQGKPGTRKPGRRRK